MLSKEKVEAVLFKMGMPANVKGFGYIVDSVLLWKKTARLKRHICILRWPSNMARQDRG